MTLVINRDSISVKLESEHLAVHDHSGGSLRRIPLVDVDRAIIIGTPSVSFHVFAKFMDKGIPCSFLTRGGRWRGVMDGDPGFHAERRIIQYAKTADNEFSTSLSRQLIATKIANSRRTIQRLAAERKLNLDCDKNWIFLSSLKSRLAHAKSANDVRGIEGIAASVYFSLLSQFFPDTMPFRTRSRLPPRDEANALLSFSYTLLANTFTSTIRAHGLDAAAGFFHRASDRAPALALDLMEPFRSSWSDRLVLNLVNHSRIRPGEHFEKPESGGTHLNDEGRKIFFHAFDEMMARRQTTKWGELSLNAIIDKTVCAFICAIERNENIEFYKSA